MRHILIIPGTITGAWSASVESVGSNFYPLVNTPDAHIYLNAIFSSLPFTKQGDHKGTLRQCLYGKMDRSAAVVIGKIFSRQLRMWTWSVGSSPALEVVILAEVGRE